MATIFHLALASDWEAAQAGGAYTTSTRGRTLAEEGFIHASRGDQWPAVRERFYADVTEPLLLLQIDTTLLGVPVVEEPAVPGGTETFPHVYGPLPVEAVVKAIPLDVGTPAPAPAAPAPSAPVTPSASPATTAQGSFTKAYLQGVFLNAGLVLLVLALGFAGILVGVAVSGQDSGVPGVLGLVGVAVGVGIAFWLYRRRG
jgi:uncharacterized protein (DUF952 family)